MGWFRCIRNTNNPNQFKWSLHVLTIYNSCHGGKKCKSTSIWLIQNNYNVIIFILPLNLSLKNAISTQQFSQTHHPLILPFHSRINPPLHHPLIPRPSTYVAHEKWEGDGRQDEWNEECGMKGRGEGEESKIGKNALWLDLKVCGISFSERVELHLLQIL